MTDHATLNVTTYRLKAASSRDEVLKAIREIVVDLIGSEELAVWTVDEAASALSLLHSDGIASWRYRTIPVGTGVIGRVAATGEPYLADDSGGEPDAPDLTACFPLRFGEAVIGAIAIFRLLPQKPRLEKMDRQLLDSLGGHVAAALHRTASGSEVV